MKVIDKINRLVDKKTALILGALLLTALLLRFLYFPENIYFGFDQARDAFISQEVLKGEIKIIGPSASGAEGIFHGALFYYLFAPIFFLSQGDPTGLSIFIRIYNTLGVILVFFIGKNLFGEKKNLGWLTGIIAATIFAFSYEQTQYALFMTHPTLVVLASLTFYLGLLLLLFRGKSWGLPISLLGLGFAFQFHFLQIFLFLVLFINLGVFRKRIPKLKRRDIINSVLALGLTLSTYILAEIKFKFQGLLSLLHLSTTESSSSTHGGINSAIHAASRFISDNIFYYPESKLILLLVLLGLGIFYLLKKDFRNQIFFLLVWLIVGLFSYYISDTSLYYYAAGTSVSLIILAAFLLSKLYEKSKIAAFILILIIISSNLYLIFKNNNAGPNSEINVQVGMLLGDEKRAMEFIYQDAKGEPFAINALSMPLYIDTTWAYLFAWYGQKNYGYLPVWGGIAAAGYPGSLVINNSRSTLPHKRYLIIEPTRDPVNRLESFMTEEGYFANIKEEKDFGLIKVYVQEAK